MKQYRIYKHPDNESEAVKLGWSWPAFSFFAIWAFAKKLWMVGMACFFVFGSIGLLVGLAEVASKGSFSTEAREMLVNVLVFIGMLFFGYRGNAWLEQDLSLRGYEDTGTVMAANIKDALTHNPATQSRLGFQQVFIRLAESRQEHPGLWPCPWLYC